VQARHIFSHPLGDKLGQGHTGAFQQVNPGLFNGIDDVAMQYQLKTVMVSTPVLVQAGAKQLFVVHLAPHRRFNHAPDLETVCSDDCERLVNRSPSFFNARLRASRGARSNRVVA